MTSLREIPAVDARRLLNISCIANCLAAATLVTAGVVIAIVGRGWFFFYDEWTAILYRRSGGLSAFFAPHDGHLEATVIAIYRILFATVGLHHYGAYKGVQIALHLILSGLLYIYARRRGLHPVLALLMLAVFAFLGSAWEVLFWPATMGYVMALIALVATLLLWDANVPMLNLWTFLLAILALASFGVGVAVVVGLGIEAAIARRGARRLVALGVPFAGWIVWYAAIRPNTGTPLALRKIPGAIRGGDVGAFHATLHLSDLPSWYLNSIHGAVAGLAGTAPAEWTWLLAIAIVGLLAWSVYYKRLDLARAISLLAVLVVFWLLTAASRSETLTPGASRYVYVGSCVILLILAECLRSYRPRTQIMLPVLGVSALLTLGALHANIDDLRGVGHAAMSGFTHERVELSQLEGCRGRLPVSFEVDPKLMPGLSAGPFWAATSALGDPVAPASRTNDKLCEPGS